MLSTSWGSQFERAEVHVATGFFFGVLASMKNHVR